jgi:hypothetical protein
MAVLRLRTNFMTKSEKMIASRAATRERLKTQTVTINQDWRILRADPLNWEIQYKTKFQGYYGTIGGALRALPDKMLNEQAKGTLTDLLRTVDGIQGMIEKAIP